MVNIGIDEQIDDLQYKGLKIIQKKTGFRFGIDAVLLANFCQVPKDGQVMDLGTGTGIIPILLAGKTQASRIIGVEIQEDMADTAKRSVLLNNLEEKVEILAMDIKECPSYFKGRHFDVITSNPPYITAGGGIVNPSDAKAIARHEIMCNLEDVIRVSAALLKPGGNLFMVNRPQRLVDAVYLMRKYGIEPKIMRFVHPYAGKKPNLVLIRASRGGNPQLKVIEPLYVYESPGVYTDEILEIYGKSR